MPALVVGTGLVGTQIVSLLAQRSERPIVLDLNPQIESIKRIVNPAELDLVVGDVLDLRFLEELVRTKDVTKIIHTAANPMLTVGAAERPYDAIKLNIMGTANVLEVARRRKVERVVFTSSSVLYNYRKGGVESGTLSEDNYPRTTTIYASTKLACENIGLNYAETYGLDFVAVRFAAVFGPWSGSGGGGPSTMFKEVIRKSLKGEPATISPRVIEFVYSKDAARGSVLASEAKKVRTRIFNIGMGKVYTPQEIVAILTKIIPEAKITIEELQVGSPSVKVIEPISLQRSREEIGYEPLYDMPKALEDYVSSFRGVGSAQ